MDLKEKTVVITSARGVGYELSKAFNAKRAKIIALAKTGGKLQKCLQG